MHPLRRSTQLPRLALGAVAVSLLAAGVRPAQAQTSRMPSLLAARQLALDAATTFSNSYGVGFEATGLVGGSAEFSSSPNPLTTNNTGTAYLSAMASFDSGSAGVLSAVSGLSQMVFTAGTGHFIIRNSSEIFADGTGSGGPAISTPNVRPTLVVSGISISGTGSSSTVGASLVGTNTGTERLQVSGKITEQVANDLNDDFVQSNLVIQLSSF